MSYTERAIRNACLAGLQHAATSLLHSSPPFHCLPFSILPPVDPIHCFSKFTVNGDQPGCYLG